MINKILLLYDMLNEVMFTIIVKEKGICGDCISVILSDKMHDDIHKFIEHSKSDAALT